MVKFFMFCWKLQLLLLMLQDGKEKCVWKTFSYYNFYQERGSSQFGDHKKKRGAYFLDEWLPVQEWLEHFVNSLISYDHDAHSFVFYTQLTKSRSNPLSSNQSELSHRHSYSLAQENPVRLPSLHTPGDWSGVPPFKVS